MLGWNEEMLVIAPRDRRCMDGQHTGRNDWWTVAGSRQMLKGHVRVDTLKREGLELSREPE